jgi:hypothetical protein
MLYQLSYVRERSILAASLPQAGTPRLTEYLQLSPAKEMAEVEQQVMKNVQAMQTG